MKKKLLLITILLPLLLVGCGLFEEDKQCTNVRILFNNELISVDVDTITTYEGRAKIKDINGKIYITGWDNILMTNE